MANAQWTVKVGGSDLGKDFSAGLTDVVIESSIHDPDLIELQFNDMDHTQIDGTKLKPGAVIEIQVTTENAAAATVSKGEITATELRFEGDKILMLVRAMDKGHRLLRGRKTKNRENVAISDVVNEIAGNAGLGKTVDSTSDIYPFIHQDNVSDAQHLRQLALLAGAQMTVLDDKLIFKVAPATQSEVLTLKLTENLHELKASMNSSDLVDSVEVRGWDPWQKKEIVGTASSSDVAKSSKLGTLQPSSLASDFGTAKMVISGVNPPTQGAATTLAKSVMGILSSSFAELEAVCDGDAKLVAGATIKLDGVGTKLAGKHIITSARHVWNAVDNYQTVVTVSGRQNRGLLGAVLGNAGRDRLGRHLGVVIGIVTANKGEDDATKGSEWGRVRVKFPWMDADTQTAWARVCNPMAGAERGFMFVPEVGDEVLVAFEHGDINHPVVIGQLWNGKDKPPLQNDIIGSDGKVNQYQLKTRTGTTITLSNEEDSSLGETFSVKSKSTKLEFTIDAKNKKVILNSLDNGTIEITADKDITVKSNQGKLTLSAQQDISLESVQGKVDIKGNGDISLTSQTGGLKGAASAGNVEFSGMQAKLAGSTGVTVDGGPQAALKGAMVKIGP